MNRIALPLLLALATTGCVMPDQLAQIQTDVAQVQQSLAAVSKTQTELSAKVADLQSKVGSGEMVQRSDLADLSNRLDEVVRQSTATADKVDQVNVRVDRLSQDVQAARESTKRLTPPVVPVPVPGEAPPPAASPGTAVTNPNALYTSAYADFSKGNYALAIQGFEEYAERFPDADLADNAMYWIGECHFSQGAFPDAIAAFDRLLAAHPDSEKAAAANLKKGLAFLEQNDVRRAIVQLRYVVSEYPQTDEAKIARDKLTSLGATT